MKRRPPTNVQVAIDAWTHVAGRDYSEETFPSESAARQTSCERKHSVTFLKEQKVEEILSFRLSGRLAVSIGVSVRGGN